jgi:hypothetical protein
MKRRRLSLVLSVLVMSVTLAPAAFGVSQEDLDRIWVNNGAVEGIQEFRFGYVDWVGSSISVEGKAPISGASPSARILAGRAAVTDARRNLLLLLYEMRYGFPERLESIDISGKVVEPHIDSERIHEGNLEISLTLPLERLLDECVIFSASVR